MMAGNLKEVQTRQLQRASLQHSGYIPNYTVRTKENPVLLKIKV